MNFLARFFSTKSIPQKLGADLAEVVLDAYSFGRRLTAHAQCGIPMKGVTDRTAEQRKFDREYIAIVLSWVGLAVDMINADLKFGSGAESKRYAQAVDDVFETIVDRVQISISSSEDKAYLQEGFTRYLPKDDDVSAGFSLVDYYFQTFGGQLTRGGLSFDYEAATGWLGSQYIEVQPKIDIIVDEYAPLFTAYCRSLT